MIPGYWGFLKQGGVLQGYPYSKNVWYVGRSAPVFGKRAGSLESLFGGAAQPNDVIFIGPGAIEEGNLVIPEDLTGLTLIGTGGRGAAFIEPSVAGDEGLQVLADDTTLINLGVADGGSGDYGLSVGSNTVSPDRFRAYGCKLEGSSVACKLWQAGDVLLEDCEFAWANTGLQLSSGAIGFCTQVMIRGSRWHNNATACIAEAAAAQQVNNFQLWNNIFDQLEDGTEPTDFILLADNGNTGIIAGNMFAIATNDAAKLTIGSGLMWGPNGTEAGWSTARPA